MERQRDLHNPQFGKDEWREVGKEIRRRRKLIKWTQEDLAGYMDSDHRVVSRHENGESMSVETLVKYASALGCTTDALLPLHLKREELRGINPQLQETLRAVSSLQEAQQLAINQILVSALNMAERAS